MTDSAKPINVTIMDKEYLLGCPEEDRESLYQAVEHLNRKLKEMKEKGKIIGAERVAVMTALNIMHEYLEYKKQNEGYNVDMRSGVRRIEDKIAKALRKKERAKEAKEKERETVVVAAPDAESQASDAA
jgi:cell division protein ZapA